MKEFTETQHSKYITQLNSTNFISFCTLNDYLFLALTFDKKKI